jgi:hypothetical protein
VRNAQRIATIGKEMRQSFRDPQPTFRHREQHHAAIRGQSPAIESGGDRLAANGWKRERQQIRVGHGEPVWGERRNGSV